MPKKASARFIPALGGLLAACGFAAGGCQKEAERDPCLQPRNAPLRIQAKQRIDTTLRDSALPTAVLIPLGGLATLRYTAPNSTIQLYLAPNADSCQYAIRPDSTSPAGDTVTFRYARRLQFLSNACGYTYFFTLQSVGITKNALDSFRITNTDVDNNANSPAHLQLYYRRR